MTGAEIKCLRARLGLTQPEFAARVGVSITTVARWEGGVNRPRTPAILAALERLARAIPAGIGKVPEYRAPTKKELHDLPPLPRLSGLVDPPKDAVIDWEPAEPPVAKRKAKE